MADMKLKKIPVHNMSEMAGMDEPSSMPPSFYVDGKQMPEIKNWEVGEKYRMVIEVVQRSKSESEHGVNGSFDIVAYSPIVKKDIEDMDDAEFEIEQGKALSRK